MMILFFHFDGTCNDPTDAEQYRTADVSISNVLKSHFLLGGRFYHDRSDSPLAHGGYSFYYPGIGCYGSLLERYFNAGLAVEQGDVASILSRALLDFQSHYHQNIEAIVLIGFSRGAALARRFAALINPFVTRPIVVEAVMDTVASIGWPNLDRDCRPTTEVVFEYGCQLPTCVVKALHLVALDEQRLAFRPTLMNQDARVNEMWLAGVHSDIGGGYRNDGLADISLQLMIDWLHSALGRSVYQAACDIALSHSTISNTMLRVEPNPLGALHYQLRPPMWQRLTLAPRSCHVLVQDTPCIKTPPQWHISVQQRMALQPDYRPTANSVLKAKICA